MKPNGFVLAASITSQRSMPIASNTTFSSFTSAIFTPRKMFSSSFVASATRQEETGTSVAIALPVERHRLVAAPGTVAAHHLGNVSDLALRVARVLALGREGQVKVCARLESRPSLEHRSADLRRSCRDRSSIPARPGCHS